MTAPSNSGLEAPQAVPEGPQLPARNACGGVWDALLFAFVKGSEPLIWAIFRGFTRFPGRIHASHMP